MLSADLLHTSISLQVTMVAAMVTLGAQRGQKTGGHEREGKRQPPRSKATTRLKDGMKAILRARAHTHRASLGSS